MWNDSCASVWSAQPSFHCFSPHVQLSRHERSTVPMFRSASQVSGDRSVELAGRLVELDRAGLAADADQLLEDARAVDLHLVPDQRARHDREPILLAHPVLVLGPAERRERADEQQDDALSDHPVDIGRHLAALDLREAREAILSRPR
jgi:hypothetical protein